MAPARKSRSVNKRFAYPGEESLKKDVENGSKTKPRKKRLSDMLGPQWSKEELQRFYEAYRKYGRDWRKLASTVRNRTVEMVEALYTMNRAYLSLPEGTASVVGLIAMMTDHYSVLDGSDSEQESNDGLGTSRKTQKRARGKLRSNAAKKSDTQFLDASESQTAASGYGCLSLLKKKRSAGIQTRAVGKRTPRFPVKHAYDREDSERYFSPTRQVSKVKVDGDDDYAAHEVALTLAEASHRGGSPQISHTPSKRRDTAISSPDDLGEKMNSESEMTSAKNIGNDADEDGCEGSLGSTDGDHGEYSRDRSRFPITRGLLSSAKQKGKKVYGKKPEFLDSGYHHADDVKEACSGTEEGQKDRGVKRKPGNEVADTSMVRATGSIKRSKKILFGEDEVTAFDALQTLADLSLMMPTTDPEFDEPPKELKIGTTKSWLLESVPGNHQREKSKGLVPSKQDQLAAIGQASELKVTKSGKSTAPDASASPDAKDSSNRKRKQKSPSSKISASEALNSDPIEVQKKESYDQGKKSSSKTRRHLYTASFPQPGTLVRTTEHSSSSTGPKEEIDDSAVSSLNASNAENLNIPVKSKSRRKADKSQIERDPKERHIKDAEICQDFVTSAKLSPDRALAEWAKSLSNCLSNHHMRRWCIFEWFYSAIDYPWFAKSEFVEYLYHVGLGHVPRLSRVEWGVIRSSLGKPRRFSVQFLKEEKEKLNYYRESVRTHYTELRTGVREGLPTDLACPLTVGQRVIAIHRRTREVHNGSVLTVDHSRCRVQFDRPELGVEFVLDIDCMPLNPSENMPASLRRHSIDVDNSYEYLRLHKITERSEDRKEEYIKFAPSQNMETADGSSHILPTYPMSSSLKTGMESLTAPGSLSKIGQEEVVSPQQVMIPPASALAQIQAKEADIQALAELTRALDKKSALVAELKRMNDDVTVDSSLKDVEAFKKQYAAVLVQLDEVFEQVSSALICLRQRNTYQGNSLLQGQKPISNLNNRSSIINTFERSLCDTQESGMYVSEIVESSKVKAQRMVDSAMQAMSSLKVEPNFLEKIEEAVDYVNNHILVDDPGMAAAAPKSNGITAPRSHFTSVTSQSATVDLAPDAHLNGASDDQEVPSELITNCVATLVMIQKCTERLFPPADVAQILDLAVTSLQPCCSQNLPIYSEIQKCVGFIRSQILALVPT